MIREGFVAGGARRRQREGGTLAQTYQSIYGPGLRRLWDSQLGIGIGGGAVDTWTDQIVADVLQAPAAIQRPTYVPDGTNFRGLAIPGTQSVAQLAVTSNAVAGLAAGLLPYAFGVVRLVGAVFPMIPYGFGNDLDDLVLYVQKLNNSAQRSLALHNGGVIGQTPNLVPDTAVHFFETWYDGALIHMAIDGVDGTGTLASTSQDPITNITIGAARFGGALVSYTDAFYGALGLTLGPTPPTATARAGGLAFSKVRFGF